MNDRFRVSRSILRMTGPDPLLGDSLFAMLLQSGYGTRTSEAPGPIEGSLAQSC